MHTDVVGHKDSSFNQANDREVSNGCISETGQAYSLKGGDDWSVLEYIVIYIIGNVDVLLGLAGGSLLAS